MAKATEKFGYMLFVAAIVFSVLEGVTIVRWLLFNGAAPSWRNLETIVVACALIWPLSKLGDWFETRDRQHKEILARVRDIDTRLESLARDRDIDTRLEFLHKWESSVSDDGEDDGSWENELNDDEKAKISEYAEDVEQEVDGAQYNLGVTYWNLAMRSYNVDHSAINYRKAIYWLRKAARLDYDCENTLGDAYIKLKEYDKAMYWYLRSVKRGGELVWIAESDIADMYAEGRGVSQNYAEAARWWHRAAQHGSEWSRYRLGKLYAEGEDGVEKDNHKAYFHLYIAASFTGENSPQKSAAERLDKVAKELGDYYVSKEKERAEEWIAERTTLDREVSRIEVKPLPLPQ